MHDDVADRVGTGTGLSALVEVCADGLALLDTDERFALVNGSACRLLGIGEAELLGRRSPFVTRDDGGGAPRLLRWTTSDGRRRDLEYRCAARPGGGYAVWFGDVTDELRSRERLTAIVRAASSVAEAGSLAGTLDAVASEIVQTAHISAVQILAIDDPAADLRVLGMAGFGAAPEFVARLGACRRLGADIRFLSAFVSAEPVVVPHRRPAIMSDPAWAPLHEIMDRPDWDAFVAMPMTVRGGTIGVINAYYEPGEDPSPSSLAFLEAMADHAAVAVDTARLLDQTRADARSAERRRLARDVHDSVVQELFSMRMQARALRSRLDRGGVDPQHVRDAAIELSDLSARALADLRLLVQELRPAGPGTRDLIRAVRTHAASVSARAELLVDVRADDAMPLDADPDAVEDLYRIIGEAVHNAVKHGPPDAVRVGIERTGTDLVLEIGDDGPADDRADRPGPPGGGLGLGLVSMRERAERWGGELVAGPRDGGGWTVRASVPLARLETAPREPGQR
ncbi:histidine kinase [Pseudonocardia nematodicida]|uniref:Histidine kinase n=1 Tax=Pseudonocardia nematodicida TaxID=1206997 RepID=A0ABV1K6T3_9PSEU